jgi:hypothetical protein
MLTIFTDIKFQLKARMILRSQYHYRTQKYQTIRQLSNFIGACELEAPMMILTNLDLYLYDASKEWLHLYIALQ